jgi:transposase
MKVTTRNVEFKSEKLMNVCSDVHKVELYFFSRLPGEELSDTCRNSNQQIEKQLIKFEKEALDRGFEGIRVVCEPTGLYDRKLLRTAHRMKIRSSYVNTENVAKYRQIETNDNGKTDTKDPKVIASLAEQGKLLKIRDYGENYMTLRKLGAIAERSEKDIVRRKGHIHKVILELFCEYDFDKDFLFNPIGKAFMKYYACNPYKIIKTGFKRFEKKMRTIKYIRRKTILRLWEYAENSVLHELPEKYINCLEEDLLYLYDRCSSAIDRKEIVEHEMVDILNELREEDPNIPPPTPILISEKNMAKLLSETGPLSDFNHSRQLVRYGGLNLRERESGTYHGKAKVSKKGRRRLRKILGNIVLPIVPKHKLYGDFYHDKKDNAKMPGNKAMMVTMRNFLRKFFGWYKAGGGEFDKDRWFNCESQYRLNMIS